MHCMLSSVEAMHSYQQILIELQEKFQRSRSHKIAISDAHSDYKTRLAQIGILPLMYIYEIADVLFLIHQTSIR